MNILVKTILTFLIAVLLTYIFYGTFFSLDINIGSLWINVNIYYLIALGIVVPLLFFNFIRILKIPYGIILIVLSVYLVITALSGWHHLTRQSLMVYILILLANGFIVEKLKNVFWRQ